MSAGVYKMTCEQGATFNLVMTWINPDGTPIDNTGYTAKMQARTAKTSPSPVLTWGTADGTIVLGGTNGKITFNVPATATAALAAGAYVYDIELTSSSGVVTRLIEGAFIVDGNVTL